MAYEETDNDGNKVDKMNFKDWLAQDWGTKSFGKNQQAEMLMVHFGFATTSLLDDNMADSCVSALDNGNFYCDNHVVAMSKFKRNNNWQCDISNLVRAEAIKLNRLSQEGTFND